MNDNFSVLSIYDVSAKTYVMNLKVVNPLKPLVAGTDGIKLNFVSDSLPSNDKLLLFYPLESNLDCDEYENYKEYINEFENTNNIDEFNRIYEDVVITALSSISSVLFDEYKGLLKGIDYWIEQLSGGFVPGALSLAQVTDVRKRAADLEKYIEAILLAGDKIGTSIGDYTIDGEFDSSLFIQDIQKINTLIETLRNEVNNFVFLTDFPALLHDNPSLIYNDVSISISDDLAHDYYESKFNESIEENLIGNAYTKLNDITGRVAVSITETSLAMTAPAPEFMRVTDPSITYDAEGESCNALYINRHGITGSHYTLGGAGRYFNYLFKLLFTDAKTWPWENKINTDTIPEDKTPFAFSNKGMTVAFWVKFHENLVRNTENHEIGSQTLLTFFITSKRFLTVSLSTRKTNINDANDTANPSTIDTGSLSNGWFLVCLTLDNQRLTSRTADDKLNPTIAVNTRIAHIVDNSGDSQLVIENDRIHRTTNGDEVEVSYEDIELASPLSSSDGDTTIVDESLISENSYIRFGENDGDGELYAYLRNLYFFAGTLSDDELRSLFKLGIQKNLDLPNENRSSDFTELVKGNKFFIGLIGVYNVSSINILNCAMKYNGKSLISDVFDD